MSIEVPLDELGEAVRARDFCYLLTVSDDQWPHLLALRPAVEQSDGLRLVLDAGGGRACRNAEARPQISLVFPPVETGGMSLVVDGVAEVTGETVSVAPTWAVLHRPAP